MPHPTFLSNGSLENILPWRRRRCLKNKFTLAFSKLLRLIITIFYINLIRIQWIWYKIFTLFSSCSLELISMLLDSMKISIQLADNQSDQMPYLFPYEQHMSLRCVLSNLLRWRVNNMLPLQFYVHEHQMLKIKLASVQRCRVDNQWLISHLIINRKWSILQNIYHNI